MKKSWTWLIIILGVVILLFLFIQPRPTVSAPKEGSRRVFYANPVKVSELSGSKAEKQASLETQQQQKRAAKLNARNTSRFRNNKQYQVIRDANTKKPKPVRGQRGKK